MVCGSQIHFEVRPHGGGQWTSYNHMTERMEYLHVRKEFSEFFAEKWGLYEQSSGKGTAPSSAISKTSQAVQNDSRPVASPDDKETTPGSIQDVGDGKQGEPVQDPPNKQAAQPEPEPAKNGKRDNPEQGNEPQPVQPNPKKQPKAAPKPKPAKQPLPSAVAGAVKVKAEYGSGITRAKALIASIQGQDEAWAWAASESTLGGLRTAMAAYDHVMEDIFVLQMQTHDMSAIRRLYKSDNELLVRLNAYIERIKPLNSNLGQEIQLLMGMQQARMKTLAH